jgi:hypothetical protein
MWKSFSKTVYFKTDKSQSFVDNRRSSEELQILASYKTVFHRGRGGREWSWRHYTKKDNTKFDIWPITFHVSDFLGLYSRQDYSISKDFQDFLQ